jgi:5'-nucleotidase
MDAEREPAAVGAVDHRTAPTLATTQVFCNRSLRLDQVRAVGFDMDYTLAIYRQAEMDRLQTELTLARLVEHGYADELAGIQCPVDFAIRGLLVDIRRGNVLKMDRYRYVKRAYHGLRLLTRQQRRDLYEARRLRAAVDRYHWVDTLYSLADVSVYAGVIDHLEGRGVEIDYRQLFADVRAAADEAHASGEINVHMQRDLPRYVERDPLLGPALHRMRSAGKRLFLLTNSRPAQTEPMMSYLLDGALPGYPSWRDYFDVIITAATKPGFFIGRRPFVDDEEPDVPVTELRRGRIYRGGNMIDFEKMAGVSGPDVLYVGDHIYGDVLRANIESGWRTVMIVQEIADELRALAGHGRDMRRLDEVDLELRLLRERQHLTTAPAGHHGTTTERIRRLEAELDELEHVIDTAYHPYWGSLFKTGVELSSFGAQLEQHAWLYTEKVSHLGRYSPVHYFRSPRALMAHER